MRAVRAEATSPMTTVNLPRAEIDQRNYGQEIPFLLKEQPSLTQYADAGSGTGYCYLSLRGIQQTRLNMTLDGVPLNEPEDSAVYFSNYGDLAASIDSVQVQRGVGTSGVGAASYGGSINFASVDPSADVPRQPPRSGRARSAPRRAALTLNSGTVGTEPRLLRPRVLPRHRRLPRQPAREAARPLPRRLTRRGERSFLKAFGFVGQSRAPTGLLAVEKDVLERDRRSNPHVPGRARPLQHSGWRTCSTPGYLSGRTSVAGQAYYQRAGGWYRIFGDGDANLALPVRPRLALRRWDGERAARTRRGPPDGRRAPLRLRQPAHARRVGAGRDYVNRGDQGRTSTPSPS